jgi:hypothetical protein
MPTWPPSTRWRPGGSMNRAQPSARPCAARVAAAGAALSEALAVPGRYLRRRPLGAGGRQGAGVFQVRDHLRLARESQFGLDPIRGRCAAQAAAGGKVIPLLLGLELSDISGPLSQFHAKKLGAGQGRPGGDRATICPGSTKWSWRSTAMCAAAISRQPSTPSSGCDA